MLDKIIYSKRLRALLATVFVCSTLLGIYSFSYPSIKRAEHIRQVGENSLSATASLSTAMTYFAGEDMLTLRQNPQIDENYRRLCGLLTRVKDSYGFERVYVVYKGVGGKFFTLLDAGYRDNATAGVDYQLPGSEYASAVQKGSRSVIDRVYSLKDPAAAVPSILTTEDHRKVIASYVPLFDHKGELVGLLVVEAAAGNTDFAKVGPWDFGLSAMISGGTAAVSLLLLFLLRGLKNSRELKRRKAEDKAAQKVEAQVVTIAPVEEPPVNTTPPAVSEEPIAPATPPEQEPPQE